MAAARERILAILNYLESTLYRSERRERAEIALADYTIPSTFPSEAEWTAFGTDETWGGLDSHFLFRSRINGREGEPLVLIVTTDSSVRWSTDNPQILVYVNGVLSGTLDMNHRVVLLADKCGSNEVFDVGFYAYSNSRGKTNYFHISSAVPSSSVLPFYFDLKNVFEAADLLEVGDTEKIRAFAAINRAIDILDTRSLSLLDESVSAARAEIIRYINEKRDQSVTVWSVGSTHIDVAWKWPVRQTRQKAVRSALTALNLMERYPSYHFLLTQPQVYESIRSERPDIFSRIKERIKEGRWEAEGGMWLESDCNMASGESLVRQLLYGKRYIEKVLGAPESEILWLPDAFGFNGNLPQIMKKAGIKYFMTTKISWSDTHIFPYDLFFWKGIDGSEILSYFISTQDYKGNSKYPDYHTTYNGVQNASQIMGTWDRFQNKDVTEDVLTCFGYGDGGGGPTGEMLENSERLSHALARAPRVRLSGVRPFFQSILERAHKALPKWCGELYFEYHRGVMTSISDEKKWNRYIEGLVHDAEALSVMAGRPELFEDVWKTIMLNQFHDILPGSAIDEVYEIAFKEYEAAAEKAKASISSSLSSLSEPGDNLVAVNTTSHKRASLMLLEEPVPGLYSERTYDGKYLYLAEDVPSYGYSSRIGNMVESGQVIAGSGSCFETPYYRITIDSNGGLSSIFDKEERREVIKKGEAGNRIVSYEDRPLRFDNWNTEDYHKAKPYPWTLSEGPEVVENGKLRAAVRLVYTSLSSKLTQHIILYRHTKRIDFVSKLDWDGDHLFVKAEFPVDVHSYKAEYEIQFGVIERSATMNTDWDRAAFEVPALRWSDLSEPGFGVSLITDSKYGYSVKEGVMTVSLLKSGTSPAENADRGVHEFVYSLYPHKGTWREGGTINEAEDLNRPLYHAFSDKESDFSFISSDCKNIVIDTVKCSEDGDGIVIRAYEAFGTRCEATISLNDVYTIYETDLLERDRVEICEGKSIERVFHPFEIVTFYLRT